MNTNLQQPRRAVESSRPAGLAGPIARRFIDSKLTPLIVITAVLLGVAAVWKLPREEEPQIKVPMIDVMVSMPGFSSEEVEQRATRPMEQLLWEIPGVEYIYSTSRPGESLVVVRFLVGEDVERSLVKLNQKLETNFDRIPPGVSFPIIKPRSIDDVPILALTFHSDTYDHLALRWIAAEVEDRIKTVADVAETGLIGGARRQMRVLVDPSRLAARGLSLAGIVPKLHQANLQVRAGTLTGGNQETVVDTGGFLENADDVESVIVGVHGGKPVYLREVAEIVDGAEEPSQYVFFGFGKAGGTTDSDREAVGRDEPAVTLTVAKRPGANAITVAESVLARVEAMRGELIPGEVNVSVTRHYGETAKEKSDELLLHMAIAVVGVSALILLVLGWRESLIVALAIPATLALTLLVFYLYGYTLNRITLFALIFSIGILVDDAIVVVENIVRHIRMPVNRGRPLSLIAIEAVTEVGNPTVLATFAVIAAVLPMAFVGGLMGPYMRPIPIGSSAAMLFSLGIAFIVTPWASVRVLMWRRRKRDESAGNKTADTQQSGATEGDAGGGVGGDQAESSSEDWLTRGYRRIMGPLIASSGYRWAFLVGVTVLLVAAFALVAVGWVKVKMLPFDNKSEFQIVLNMPEGTALEQTARVAREMARAVAVEPEVTDYQVYAGTAAPYNFNGLVRHYFLRKSANQADVQVNLIPKQDRTAQSHDIVKRVRPRVKAIAERHGGRVALAEVPPGPPVLQTLVAEIYGPTGEIRRDLAGEVMNIFHETDGVVDVDWYVEADQPRTLFRVDKEKAALHGISAESISQTLRMAVSGMDAGLLHLPRAREDVPIRLELPRSLRDRPEALLSIKLRAGDANALPEPIAAGAAPVPLVPLREVVRIDAESLDRAIYHKNLLPVTYVIGDVAGEIESPVYAIASMNRDLRRLDGTRWGGSTSRIPILNIASPESADAPSIKWDGEWQITLEVFRDLGTAFATVLILIYVLMVGWFRSFLTPLIVMVAIPFSLVGILPAHGAMGAFFSATSMIGFMAGAGIVVRNSIILVDFIEQRLSEGMPLHEAVVDAGAVRFRPMLLTAMAVVVGAAVILFDPIFQGLALSLMAGEIASLTISRMAVPVLFFMAARDRAATDAP